MKSHPDAASRSAAEVVTQLPVPSRLGMLRFERLNEPSWSLLFLDPACERQLGVSAGELCALLDSPYASLMEPEARYQLHDDIQRQLASTQHYSVRYRLHTPNGALHLLEIGESFQQRGRFLRGGTLFDLGVEIHNALEVFREVLLGLACGCGADDHAHAFGLDLG